ncbi:MAG: ATP synthase F1 subunit gamma [Planctomycetota bacterium]|nr:ATP synthase F1 subunit gamma [Planctomycetota bacterium]
MAGIKELRQRIQSVGSIKQITRAMEMVATTKLRRFQDRATSSRPYAEEITGLVGRMAAMLGDGVEDRPLFRAGAGEKTLALVVTSDRGLCGPYNSYLLRQIEGWRAEHPRPVEYLVYGRKGIAYMNKRDFEVKAYLQEPPLEQMDYRSAAVVARILVKEFLSGDYHDVMLMTTRFVSMAKFVPEISSFLPISGAAFGEGDGAGSDLILEPDAETIFDQLLPRYLETRVFNALLEALASEYASRRFAMKNATDAATDMQAALRGVYNRKRQESITKELLDIVGGAEAVK